jgi:hypothetical protein
VKYLVGLGSGAAWSLLALEEVYCEGLGGGGSTESSVFPEVFGIAATTALSKFGLDTNFWAEELIALNPGLAFDPGVLGCEAIVFGFDSGAL